MSEDILSEKMKSVLQYKERIRTHVRDIITMLGDGYSQIHRFDSIETNQKVQDILSLLSDIGSLADNERSYQIRQLIDSLRSQRHNISQLDNESKMKSILVDIWLSTVNTIVFRLDEKKGSWKLSFNLDPLRSSLGWKVEKEN